MVKKVPSDKQELSFGTRWDKLRTWHLLKDEIEAKCQEPEKFDCGITIDIGPQVFQKGRLLLSESTHEILVIIA